MAVWYGSQTGTAESFARSLHSELQKRGIHAQLLDVAHAPSASHVGTFTLSLFCQATYGDGEPTDDAHWFFEQLHALPDTSLRSCTVGVFALGNKQYEHFAAAGKTLRSALLNKGASEVCELGTGDDDGDIDSDFSRWKEDTCLPQVLHFLGAADRQDTGSTQDDPPLVWDVHYGENVASYCHSTSHEDHMFQADHTNKPMRVVQNKQLCAENAVASGKSTVHVELELPGVSYSAGDHLAVQPKHAEKHVVALADAVGLAQEQLEQSVALTRPEDDQLSMLGDKPFEGSKRLMDALAEHVELGLAPPRSCLKQLAKFCSNPADAERLHDAASTADKWRSRIESAQLCLREVVSQFAPSCNPPVGALLGGCAQKLLPRRYSLASSPLFDGHILALSCSVVRMYTPNGRFHEGVASTALEQVRPTSNGKPVDRQSVVHGTVRGTSFKLPESNSTPIVLICAGTGIAPFRAFLRERRELAKRLGGTDALGECLLYFGCRSNSECLYQEELQDHNANGELTHLRIAFSRPTGDENTAKEYVQDALAQPSESTRVYRTLFGCNGKVYVCGDAGGMAHGVHDALMQIVIEHEDASLESAEKKLKTLSETGRYMRDVW